MCIYVCVYVYNSHMQYIYVYTRENIYLYIYNTFLVGLKQLDKNILENKTRGTGIRQDAPFIKTLSHVTVFTVSVTYNFLFSVLLYSSGLPGFTMPHCIIQPSENSLLRVLRHHFV